MPGRSGTPRKAIFAWSRWQVTAVTVFEDGTISGASVGASNANTAVTQCLRAMLPGLRLEGGIPGAPRPVSASIDVAR